MKVDAILMADPHLRDSTPVCRKDDYIQAMLGKLGWICKLQEKYDCPVFNAGDLLHNWKSSPFLLASILNFLPNKFITVPGNHDLKNHNLELIDQSGLAVLCEAGKISVLNNEFSNEFSGWKVYGAAWDSEIPKQKADILMCHEMVYQSPEHWQKKNGDQALSFLKKYKGYQLIVTGHNHKPFTAEHEGRLLVNPGSLMRMTADQKDYKPRVYLWNKESNTVKIEYVPIDKEAVEIAYLEKSKARDERLESFIDKLQGSTEVGLSFEKNLEAYLANNRVRTSVKDVINECIGEGV